MDGCIPYKRIYFLYTVFSRMAMMANFVLMCILMQLKKKTWDMENIKRNPPRPWVNQARGLEPHPREAFGNLLSLLWHR